MRQRLEVEVGMQRGYWQGKGIFVLRCHWRRSRWFIKTDNGQFFIRSEQHHMKGHTPRDVLLWFSYCWDIWVRMTLLCYRKMCCPSSQPVSSSTALIPLIQCLASVLCSAFTHPWIPVSSRCTTNMPRNQCMNEFGCLLIIGKVAANWINIGFLCWCH